MRFYHTIFLPKANIALAIGANTKAGVVAGSPFPVYLGRVIGNLREVIYQGETILLQEEA